MLSSLVPPKFFAGLIKLTVPELLWRSCLCCSLERDNLQLVMVAGVRSVGPDNLNSDPGPLSPGSHASRA